MGREKEKEREREREIEALLFRYSSNSSRGTVNTYASWNFFFYV